MREINWQAIWSLLDYKPTSPLLFNSADFFLLFSAFFAVYLLLRSKTNLRIVFTLAFSLYFYYLSSGFFFFLLIFSTLADFVLGHFIYNARSTTGSKFFLGLSIAINLGLLGYFKYTNFLIDLTNGITGLDLSFKKIFLPVGISFYTFQTMSYSIDVYRKKLVPLTNYVNDLKSLFQRLNDFAFFVSFFPQLVAGPIVRAADFIPQIRKTPTLNKQQLGQALLLISGGLFKKAVISDYISVNFVDRVFEAPALYSGFENLMAVYGYAIQIYCDFSGYSDMAIGLALILGFHLPENFRKPYQAHSIRNFWQRWHISLSTWLRDYLYIGLGGNRKGKWRTYGNLMITMLLGGLWHGAGWVFVVWGGLHGFALAADRLMEGAKKGFSNPAVRALLILLAVHIMGECVILAKFYGKEPEVFRSLTQGNLTLAILWLFIFGLFHGLSLLGKQPEFRLRFQKVAARIFVFHFVALAWIFFRSGALNNPLSPLETTSQVLGQILASFDPGLIRDISRGYAMVFSFIMLGFILHFLPERLDKKVLSFYERAPVVLHIITLTIMIWAAIQAAGSEVVPFIYFQF
ncbi:MAG: MBOAT family protein [Lewinellaceae bacterium]|nr:MBOAT family protein [Lewinellaceae bacterium]